MLPVESSESVLLDRELIVSAAEPPVDLACPIVQPRDLSEVPELSHVVTVSVDGRRIRIVEISEVPSYQICWFLNPIREDEVVPHST